MRPYHVLLPLMALAGCATGPSLATRMAAYSGATEETLVQSLGVPDKQITVNGIEYLAYDQRSEQVAPGDDIAGPPWPYWGPFWGPDYGAAFDYGAPRDIVVWACETTFMLKQGHVFGFTMRGNNCS